MKKTTEDVKRAAEQVPHDMQYRAEIVAVLTRAHFEAWEQEEEFRDMGKPYLRTFLKTTPLGIAIRELAEAILQGEK